MRRLPQVLVNVSGVDKNALETCGAVSDAVSAAQEQLSDRPGEGSAA